MAILLEDAANSSVLIVLLILCVLLQLLDRRKAGRYLQGAVRVTRYEENLQGLHGLLRLCFVSPCLDLPGLLYLSPGQQQKNS